MSGETFQLFVNRRSLLNEKLDSKRLEVDGAIEILQEADADASVAQIGYLAGLLLERRDLLSELAALDDAFVAHLLTLRSRSAQDGGPVPR
jgi:hypothetical protein